VALSSVLLDGRIGFDKQELDIFKVSEMSYDSYIRVDQPYFKQDVDVKQIHKHADMFLGKFDEDQNWMLDPEELEDSLILSLDNAIPGFNDAQVVTLWSIFQEVDDRDGRLHYPYAQCVVWDLQTFQEFAKLSTKLTDGVFLFTGLELLESLSSKKLSTLFKHPWKSREKELEVEVDEVEIQDEQGNRKGFITMLAPDKAETLLEEKTQKQEQRTVENTKNRQAADIGRLPTKKETFVPKSKTLHQVTDSQKKSLETVSFFWKEMCVILNLDNSQPAENQADTLNHTFDPFDVTNLPYNMEVLSLKLTSCLKGLVEEHQR
jgi:hypothetical protein